MTHLITVYGCEADEASVFTQFAARFGVKPTIVEEDLTVANANMAQKCISIAHKSEVTAEILEALKAQGVEYISTRSIGYNHIDLEAAARLGIEIGNVTYSPDGNADFAVMLMLMAIRGIKPILEKVKVNDFRLNEVRGSELHELTVGVLGTGHIGQAVIERLQGFGCHVLAYDIANVGNKANKTAAAASYVSFPELLANSDILTVHVPLTDLTRHLVGAKEFASMKPGAILINTARGAIIDTEALISALDEGHISGAALDVLEGESGIYYSDYSNRDVQNSSLIALQNRPNVILTPHTAFHTKRALYDTVENTLINCLEYERT